MDADGDKPDPVGWVLSSLCQKNWLVIETQAELEFQIQSELLLFSFLGLFILSL